METICIHIEGLDPVGKGRPRFTRSGHAYTPEPTKKFEKAVAQYAQSRYSGPVLDIPVSVFLDIKYRIPKSWSKKRKEAAVFPGKPDGDNVLKSILDALQGIIYTDDALVADMHVHKRYAVEPSISIMICEAE